MSFLLIVFLSVLVLVVAAAWIVIRVIEVTFKGVARGVTAVATGGKKRRRRDRDETRDRCANDRCNATWRKDARFCHRCGQARHPALAGPRPSREMRVA